MINTTAPVTTTEKVAIATDNGGRHGNQRRRHSEPLRRSREHYRSVTKEEAEKMAAEVTKIVDEEENTLADLK